MKRARSVTAKDIQGERVPPVARPDTVHGIENLLKLVPPWHMSPRQELLRTRLFTVSQRHGASPRSPSKAGEFIRLESADWVNVIAVTPDQHVVTIEQFRHGIDEVTLEVPGGTVDPGELPLQAGLRELAEESGYHGQDARIIGSVTPNPAVLSNRCHTLLVCNAQPGELLELDDNEEIAVRLVPLGQIAELTRTGVIHHALVLAAFHHFLVGGYADSM